MFALRDEIDPAIAAISPLLILVSIAALTLRHTLQGAGARND
jgi:hypothetical protein